MPLIIAATDFSDVAQNAVNYACTLAVSQKADVMIIHSFIVPVMFSDIPMPVSLMNDAQKDADEQMKTLSANMALAYPAIQVSGKVIYGDTIGAIEEYSTDTRQPWLVVVGNSSTGEEAAWPDSILIDAFRKLKFPVLAVPPGASFGNVKKLCFAFDNKHTGHDAAALQQLTDISARLSADLHVLFAQPNMQNTDNDQGIDEAVKKGLDVVNTSYHIVYGAADIDKAIEDFIEKNTIDWLIMIPRRHSFFEGLFHKSHTKSVAHHSHIPILALHEND